MVTAYNEIELLKIINEGGIQTVNARNLHLFLKVGKDFSSWMKDRIEKYGFIEGEDFSPNLVKSPKGRPTIEYHISLDMAKELSMVQNNERGREARRHFIKIEKHLRHIKADPETFLDLLIESRNQLRKQVESQQPAVNFVKQISASEGSVRVGDFAKILFDRNNLLIGQNRLFQWLYSNKYLMDSQTPYQKYIEMGIFEVVTGTVKNSTSGRIWQQVKITAKGVTYLADKILESNDFNPNQDNTVEVL